MIFFVAALCGGALVLSLAPFDLWPLAFVSAGGLYWLLERHPGQLRRIAAGFGLAKYGFGVSWIYVSIHVYGAAPPWLAAFLVALLVVFMSLFVWGQLRIYLWLRGERLWLNWLLFAGTWVLGEWFWTWFLTGFPWLFAGYGQLGSPLAGYAPVGGVLLVSWLVALVGCALADARRQSVLSLALVPALFAGGFLLDRIEWTQPGKPLRVALVQGNTEQSVKWNADQRDAIVRTHLDLTTPVWGRADVIVWPEGAITYWAHEAGWVLERLGRQGERSGSALLTGISIAEREGDDVRAYNGAVVVGDGHGVYRKHILVPFGEYVPLEGLLRGLIAFFDLPMSGFSSGASRQPLLDLKGVPAALLICYEIAYPEATRRQGADADLLVTISNDTWFGASIGPRQHMQMAAMRAKELGRWLLRATNNGVTATVRPDGSVAESLPQFEAAVLETEVETRSGRTPYALVGQWPVLVLVLVSLMLCRTERRRSLDVGSAL
ncbi:MAG: apolipoprotein N-acyltransferase [Pseudomonadales bacterium]|nr:apolipoprotein N-acyltransferase [Pseudomonadales bacterium]